MTVLSIPSRALTQVATRRRVLARPATELPRMTRYRGGTYSHTVDTIVFADGTTARTDLIRLNPNLRRLLPGLHRHRATPSRRATGWGPGRRCPTCAAAATKPRSTGSFATRSRSSRPPN